MDGFSGFKTATTEELPGAVAVMDPFHVVRLAGNALDTCRRRVQQEIHGHRGRKGDPLYAARRTLHTGATFRTPRQQARLDALFADERHLAVEVTWGIYQRMIAAYRNADRKAGRALMVELIGTVSSGVPAALRELITLGRTLKQRSLDVLAYFDRPGTSNGPTEAINARLEHLRGSALGFRNLANYIARSCSKPAASDRRYTLKCDEPHYNGRTCKPGIARSIRAKYAPARCGSTSCAYRTRPIT